MRTSYNAFFFVTFKPWDERTTRAEQFQAIKAHLNQELSRLPAAVAFSFSPPAIPGVGTSGGFTFMLEDRAGSDVQFLAKNLGTFLEAARKRPEIASLSTTFLPSVPQEFVDVDRDKVLKQGVALNDVYRTIQAFMGGYFINYFNRFGRQWQVYIEAEGEDRAKAENVGQFYVRNNKGENVPLSTLTTVKPRLGPEFTMRFNEYRSAQINGSAAPGYSADQATAALEEVFKQTMPREMGFDYSGMSFQEQKAREGVPASVIFGLSLLFVFLILAALYESWSLPFSVLLSTPVAVFGAFGILWLRRVLLGVFLPPYMVQIESDVYSQIGLVMLIGLAAKNAILIVEFAKDEYEKGKPLVDAALEGARLRLRPILMTSFAFILGCVPLWTATGAGSVARQIMGTTVIGGMLAASADRNLLRPGDILPGGEMVGRGQGARFGSIAGDARAGAGGLRWITAASDCAAEWRSEGDEETSAIRWLQCWPRVLLAGCMVGPNYHRPAVQTPAAYRDLSENPQVQAQAASYADLPWWQVFQDPQLQELIRTALKQNYDLQLATERINAGARSLPSRAPVCSRRCQRQRQFQRRQRT